MVRARVFVIDEHEGQELGTQVKAILEQGNLYRVHLMDTPHLQATDVLATPPDLIIPVISASKEMAEKLSEFSKLGVRVTLLPIIKLEDLGTIFDEGFLQVNDFLVTPLRKAEVRARVRRLLFGCRAQERSSNREALNRPVGLDHLLGKDPVFLEIKRRVPLVAQFESPVLITGETGTGKEMCARALHYLSHRSGKPFLPVNCGAIPVELFENELFGHQKGAFTSASTAQLGLIAEAEGGTLFLDEIETLSPQAQAKLLRFVQDQSYYVVGSPKPKRANVWIIASTNVDLPCRVQAGSFREDLFYRLAVMTLSLPPLRQRPLDVPLLAAHFLTRHTKQPGSKPKQLSPRALQAFCQYSWPGNVRELENLIQQLIVFVGADTIEPEHLPIPVRLSPIESGGSSFKNAKTAAIEQFEKSYVEELLRIHQGNVTQAARDAKKERRAFGRLIKKYHISTH